MTRGKMLGLAAVMVSSLTLINGCVPAPEGAPQKEFDWTTIVFLILIFGVMYLVFIKPQRKRQKQQQQQHLQMVSELKRGEKVITAGGIYGQIESFDEESVVIKVESGTTMRVARQSIALRREQ